MDNVPGGILGLLALVFGAVVALFAGKAVWNRGKASGAKEGEKIGTTNESVRRENAGKAAELEVTKKQSEIARKTSDDVAKIQLETKERTGREPTPAEVEAAIRRSKE